MLTNAYEIPFTLAAGASLVLPAGSFEFVYLSSVSAGASVRLKGSQASVDLTVGRRVEFGEPTKQPVALENVGSGTVSGVLLVGSGGVSDSQVVGTVSVVDGGLGFVKARQSFSARLSSTPAATEYAGVQLFNPAGSGRLVVVDQFDASSSVASTIGLAFGVAEQVAGVAGSPESQYLGDLSSSVCSAWQEGSAVAWPSVAGYVLVGGMSVQANQTFDKTIKRPFIIPPGEGLLVFLTAVDSVLGVTLYWYEESI